MDISKIKGHGAMMGAEVMWGAGAPLGKFILAGSVSPLLLTDCRIIGTAALFWLLSLFTPSEHVSPKDLLLIFFASLLGIVFNQCLFLFGLSYTSPINASIITTSLPIVTMVMAAIFLREPVTKLKVGGVFLGAIGALILIMSGTAATGTGSALGGRGADRHHGHGVVGGSGLCARSHLPQLSASACGAEEPAAYGDIDVQLRAAHRGVDCGGVGRDGPLHSGKGCGRSAGVRGRVPCEQE